MKDRARCVCGCGRRAVQKHHVIYRQHLRQYGGSMKEKRNIVPMALECHGAHHSGARRLRLSRLPDGVFEYAVELMDGPGPAAYYLERYYSGSDPRLDALLMEA